MKLNAKIVIPVLVTLLTVFACTDDDSQDFQEAPNGQYRIVDIICYCSITDDGSIDYWIFDLASESMTILIVDSDGQELSSEKFFYGTEGKHLLIGNDGRKYSQKTVSGFLELTYLDNPEISDDEIVIILAPY